MNDKKKQVQGKKLMWQSERMFKKRNDKTWIFFWKFTWKYWPGLLKIILQNQIEKLIKKHSNNEKNLPRKKLKNLLFKKKVYAMNFSSKSDYDKSWNNNGQKSETVVSEKYFFSFKLFREETQKKLPAER